MLKAFGPGAVLTVITLIGGGCTHSGNGLDEWSYSAGYHSAGPSLVKQGSTATAACQDALIAAQADLSMAHDLRTYDSMSFNSGCYDAIRADGDPVTNAGGAPVPGYGER